MLPPRHLTHLYRVHTDISHNMCGCIVICVAVSCLFPLRGKSNKCAVPAAAEVDVLQQFGELGTRITRIYTFSAKKDIETALFSCPPDCF